MEVQLQTTSSVANMTLSTWNGTSENNLTSWKAAVSLPERIVTSVIFSILITWTIIGNITVLISVKRSKQLRKTQSNYLIGNLAVSDLLLGVVVLPFSALFYIYGYWPLGKVTCYIWLVTDVLLSTASIWGLLVIAIDRYSATFFPVWYRHGPWTKRLVFYILLVWIVSTLTSVPPLFGFGSMTDKSYHGDPAMCELFGQLDFVLYSTFMTFLIPSIALIILYSRIFIEIRNRTLNMNKMANLYKANLSAQEAENGLLKSPNQDMELDAISMNSTSNTTEEKESIDLHASVQCIIAQYGSMVKTSEDNSTTTVQVVYNGDKTPCSQSTAQKLGQTWRKVRQSRKNDKKEEKATRIMLTIVIVFMFCWLPFFCMYVTRSVIKFYCPKCDVPEKVQVSIIWLGYANSAINPLLYTAFNIHFRQAFKSIWTCKHRF